MCVTDPETKWKRWNHLIPRTAKILPSSWFGRVFAYSIQFQLRSSIHLVRRADCHFLLEIHTLHWPYVLCQTETLSPTFSEFPNVWACDRSVVFVLCVCAQCVSVLDNRQTRPLPSLVTASIWFCLCCLRKWVPWAQFLPGFLDSLYSGTLGCFLTLSPNAKSFFLLSS